MSYELIVGPRFKQTSRRFFKKYASFADDFEQLIAGLKSNPQAGAALGRDCFKIQMRIKSKNAGKSGGVRVITCVKIVDEKIYLLAIYDKSEQSTITDQERDDLLRENRLL